MRIFHGIYKSPITGLTYNSFEITETCKVPDCDRSNFAKHYTVFGNILSISIGLDGTKYGISDSGLSVITENLYNRIKTAIENW
jgi:hypothetical protein